MDFNLDERALADLAADMADDLLDELGDEVAGIAEADAPKLTGAGAASIHAEHDGDAVKVGWSTEHDYLFFSEVGDERQPAKPFLRPALDAVNL